MIKLAQLSDLHLLAEPSAVRWDLRPQQLFDEVLALALQQQPDALLLTGDLVHDESHAGYRRLAQQLAATQLPVLAIPGNHDDPALIRQHFGEAELKLNGVTVIGLDTHIHGSDCGFLGSDQIARLAKLLAASTQPCLVVLHHPPVTVGSRWIDELGLTDADDLACCLEAHTDNVIALLSGHVHQDFTGVFAGKPILSCPSTNRQFAPGASEFATESVAPGFRLCEIKNGTLSSAVLRLS